MKAVKFLKLFYYGLFHLLLTLCSAVALQALLTPSYPHLSTGDILFSLCACLIAAFLSLEALFATFHERDKKYCNRFFTLMLLTLFFFHVVQYDILGEYFGDRILYISIPLLLLFQWILLFLRWKMFSQPK